MQYRTELLAYHGTYRSNVFGIMTNGFRKSSTNGEWLGEGVYFFDESLDGKGNAKKWAYYKWGTAGWPNESYSVLSVLIETDNFLDLLDSSQLELFNRFRDEYVESMSATGIDLKAYTPEMLDCVIINAMCKKYPVGSIRQSFFMPFWRDYQLNVCSHIPNCVVICVKDNNAIKKIAVDEEGEFDV